MNLVLSDAGRVPMPSDFRQRIGFFRDATRELARGSPCPVCERPSGELCDPRCVLPPTPKFALRTAPLTPGGMHWARYPKTEQHH